MKSILQEDPANCMSQIMHLSELAQFIIKTIRIGSRD